MLTISYMQDAIFIPKGDGNEYGTRDSRYHGEHLQAAQACFKQIFVIPFHTVKAVLFYAFRY